MRGIAERSLLSYDIFYVASYSARFRYVIHTECESPIASSEIRFSSFLYEVSAKQISEGAFIVRAVKLKEST